MAEEEARAAALARRRRLRLLGAAALAVAVAVLVGLSGRARPVDGPERPGTGADASLPEGCERRAPATSPPQPLDAPPEPSGSVRDLEPVAAVIRTSCGDIEVDLAPELAPRNVASFAFLARRGFYDGLVFHRVEKDSVLQAGDPNGANLVPPDGPGYSVSTSGELPARARDYVYGVVGMAPLTPESTGSQFFIVVHDYQGALEGRPEPAGYQPRYPIIGEVARSSWDVLQRIARVETKGGNDPVVAVEPRTPIVIDSIALTPR